ncbi:MAG: hypothetical protein E7537_04505 [Ruminococcaceae bacterium]|nr:hypothetical protein [Oscillospiraceae bacterium]
MTKQPKEIFAEYTAGINYKSSLGKRGMFEQNRINERFYIGDQWYGANCGNERPLVRHNIIKRIGDYKMSQVLNVPTKVEFSAEGIPTNNDFILSRNTINNSDTEDITIMTSAFSKYFDTTAERVNFSELQDKVLHNAYITGTGVLYTYWDSEVQTGLYADDFKTVKIKGDICCQVLDIEDVYFGDPYIEEVENQPYIIISTVMDTAAVLREARLYGADISALRKIEESQTDGKITVLTKLFKEYKRNKGYTIKCIKVCENEVVRPEFDTELKVYPISIFKWERKNNSAYGESEITYLVPNQIAINRMITANVWSAMTTGMPIMLVNGDTVTGKITNEPGQIIKVFGSNEDVAGAVKYVTPPTFEKNYDQSINSLINNTLTQSGANEVALGDSRADNATALITMRNAALMPLQIVKNRFYSFVELTARIWAQFWILKYGNRKIKIKDENGIWYLDFNAERYKDLIINTKVDVQNETSYTDKERADILISLYDKGIINREQLVVRLPDGMVSDRGSLLENNMEVAENDR